MRSSLEVVSRLHKTSQTGQSIVGETQGRTWQGLDGCPRARLWVCLLST